MVSMTGPTARHWELMVRIQLSPAVSQGRTRPRGLALLEADRVSRAVLHGEGPREDHGIDRLVYAGRLGTGINTAELERRGETAKTDSLVGRDGFQLLVLPRKRGTFCVLAAKFMIVSRSARKILCCRYRPSSYRCSTGGSNPVPSSGESVANSGNRATQMALVRYCSAFFQDQLARSSTSRYLSVKRS